MGTPYDRLQGLVVMIFKKIHSKLGVAIYIIWWNLLELIKVWVGGTCIMIKLFYTTSIELIAPRIH
jgi:hypothetical protein